MLDYKNSKIYKVVSPNEEMVYVGSTKNNLSVRMSIHKHHYKLFKEGKKIYLSIFEIFEKYPIDQIQIKLIENYPCQTKQELLKREGHFIQSLKNCVNMKIAGLTEQESKKIYRTKNRVSINAKYKEYYSTVGRQKKKEYYLKNREKILNRATEHYYKNKNHSKSSSKD